MDNYLKIPFRHLLRSKLVSVISIAGLSLGLCCCILIFLYVKDELSFDRFHKNSDRLYQLTCIRTEQDGSSKSFAIASMVQGPAFKKDIPEIAEFTRVNPKNLVIKKADQVFNEGVTWVDPNFFRVFTFPFISGGGGHELDDPHSMVLTAAAATKYFGSTDAVGKTLDLEIDGRFQPFIVTAVVGIVPENSGIRFNILLPFATYEKINPDNGWMWVSFPTYFLLKEGADAGAVPGKMQRVYQAQAAEEIDLNKLAGYSNKFSWGMEPMTSMHLNNRFEGTPGATDPLYPIILTVICGFILLIACINFINLSTAQSLKRQKEIGIRKVLGTSRSRLVLRFFSESLVVCFFAFVLALAVAMAALPWLNRVSGKQLEISNFLNAGGTAGLAGIYALTALVAGFYPAWILSTSDSPVALLSGRARISGRDRFAKGLVVFQFAIAGFLMIATMLVSAQFKLLTTSSVGYPEKNLVSVVVAKGISDPREMELYRARLAAVAGVSAAGSRNIGRFGGKTQAAEKTIMASYQHIDEYFIPTLGADIISGRNFSKSFPSDSAHSVLVNQAFVLEMHWDEPIGKTIDYLDIPGWGNRKITVIGVVKDYHSESLKEKIQPVVFTEDNSLPMGFLILRLRPDHIAQTLVQLDHAYRALNPDHPFEYTFQDEANQQSYAPEARWNKLIGIAAAISLLISVTGLLGLSLLTAAKREKEIGIRKVLGASTGNIMLLLSREFMLLVFLSFLMSVPSALIVMSKWLQNFPFRVTISWWRITLATGTIMLTTLATISHQIYRSAMKSPVKIIRN